MLASREENINKIYLKQNIAYFFLPLSQEELKDIWKIKVHSAWGFVHWWSRVGMLGRMNGSGRAGMLAAKK